MEGKTLEARRKDEWAYYSDLYENHGYKGLCPRKGIRHNLTNKICLKYGDDQIFKNWLDVGAGEHVISIPSFIRTLVRTDPGHKGVKDSFAIHQLVEGYGENAFDVVSCFDVLEHLLPEELEEGISSLWNVCAGGGRIMVSVGTDEGGPWNGRATHLTREPIEWWKKTLQDIWQTPVDHVATAKGTSPFYVANKLI